MNQDHAQQQHEEPGLEVPGGNEDGGGEDEGVPFFPLLTAAGQFKRMREAGNAAAWAFLKNDWPLIASFNQGFEEGMSQLNWSSHFLAQMPTATMLDDSGFFALARDVARKLRRGE